MKEAEKGTSRGQAHTKQWSSGNLVLIFTCLGMKVDGREGAMERRSGSLRVSRVVNLTV